MLAHEPGSPGSVFLLDENRLVDLLSEMGYLTNGAYVWSETAGLKQLIRERTLTARETIDLVKGEYGVAYPERVA